MTAQHHGAPSALGRLGLMLAAVAALAAGMAPGQALANTPPHAVAGGPYVVTPGWIMFDGTGSWDADLPSGDRIVDYSWGFLAQDRVVASGARPQVSADGLYNLAAQASGHSPIANPVTGLPAWSLYLTVTDSGGLTHTALTTLRFLDGDYQVPSVPEPGAWALLGAGLGVLALVGRRRAAPPGAGVPGG